jgi:hypothetical protein
MPPEAALVIVEGTQQIVRAKIPAEMQPCSTALGPRLMRGGVP